MARRKPKKTATDTAADDAPATVPGMVAQPSVRVFTKWTPAMTDRCLGLADAGEFRQLSSLCDEMLADDRLNMLIFKSLIGGLRSLPFSFEDDLENPASDAELQEQAIEDWRTMAPAAELSKVIAWGIMAGFSLAQLQWSVVNGRHVPTLKPWHMQHSGYDHDKASYYVLNTSQQREYITPGDGRWVLFTPYGKDRPWASGLWRGAATWFVSKRFAIGDMSRASEKGGILTIQMAAGVPSGPSASSGTLNGKSAARTGKRREATVQDIASAGRGSVVQMPPGHELGIVESKGSGEIYERQIKLADNSFTLSVLTQNLTTEVTGGSLAAAQSHADELSKQLGALGELVSQFLRDSLLAPWALFNFGAAEKAPWPWWDATPPENNDKQADVRNKSAEFLARLEKMGFGPKDEAQVSELLGFAVKRVKVVEPAEEPDPDPDPDPEPPEGNGKPKARTSGVILASGDDPDDAEGFIDGQEYADALVLSLAEATAEASDSFRADLMKAVEDGENHHEVLQNIVDTYGAHGLPLASADVIQKALVLAELAGRYAVQVDAAKAGLA